MNNGLTWKRNVLPNGLTVLEYPNKTAMTAQLSIAVKYGSIDDESDKVGTAHFLEHMLVGGSKKRIKLNRQIEELGGASNFETTFDSTFISVSSVSESITKASQILSELLFDNIFENDKLEIERKVILNEAAEYSDNPQCVAQQTLVKNLFPKHPIRHPISGTRKDLKQRTMADIETAHSNYYIPKNLVLILTGNYKVSDAVKIVSMFEDRENIGLSRKLQPIERSKPKKESKIKKAGINQSYFCFGLRTPPATGKDTNALGLINSVLGLGESSRLFVELREKRGLTYSFESSNNTGLDFGYFSIACSVKNNLLSKTQEIIKTELEKLTTIQVPEEELEKSKNQIIGGLSSGMDDPSELPRILADYELMFENETELNNYLKCVKQLTSQELLEIAEKYFREEDCSSSLVIPKKV